MPCSHCRPPSRSANFKISSTRSPKGLEANQKVATTNLLNLKHGMPVKVQPAKAN